MKVSVGLITFFIFITGCSQNKSSSEQKEQVVEFNAGVGVTTTSGNFGEIQPNNSKVVTFSITNTGDATLIGPPTLDNTKFSIIYKNGCDSILPTKKCSIKVSFDAKGKAPGVHESNLNLDSFFLALSATIPAPPVEDPEVPTIKARFQATSSSTSEITQVDFGTLSQSQSVVKTVYLKNMGTQVLNSTVIAPVNYLLIYDSCSNKNIAAAGTCYVKLSLSGAGKSGSQNGVVTYGGASLNLIGSVLAPNALPPAVTPNPNIDYLLSNVVITSVDFGEISQSESKTQTITLKNSGNVALNNTVNMSGTDYLLIYDACSSKNLAVGSSCSIKVSISGSGKSGTISSSLSYEGKTLNLSTNVATAEAPSANLYSDLKFLNNSIEVTHLDIGSVPYNTSQQIILNIKNMGTISDSPAKSASINNSDFSIGYNQCINKSLAVNESCQVRVIFSSNGKANGSYNSILSFGSKTFNLSAQVGVVLTYLPTYSAYGACSATLACDGIGSKNRTLSDCKQVRDGVEESSVTLSNCSSFEIPENLTASCNSPAGQKTIEVANGDQVVSCLEGSSEQSFVSVSCDSNYHIVGQLCEADVITYNAYYSNFGSCSAANSCDGVGSKDRTISDCKQVRDGVEENSVALSNCSSFEIPDNLTDSCLSPAGEKVVSIDNGSKTLSCLEGSEIEMFVSLNCTSPYIANNTSQICEMPQSTTPSATGLKIGGFASQTYATSLTQFVGFNSPQNIASAMFYEGTTCSGTALQSSLVFGTLYQVVFSPGEGTRHMSARVYNSLMETGNCVTSSVIVDTIVPTLATTLSSTTTYLASQAPNITFTYSDSGTGIETVKYYVSKMPYAAENYDWNASPAIQGQRELTTSVNSYQAVYDPTTDEIFGQVGALYNLLPYNTPLYIIIEVKDIAGNYSYQSKQFTSTENLEFSFKYADTLPLANSNEVITYYLNRAFLNQIYLSSGYGIEEYGDALAQTKKYEAASYYGYYLPSEDVSCLSEGGTWDATNSFCDFPKDLCLSKGLIYAAKGNGQAPTVGQGHCGVPQFKVGFGYADMQTVSGNTAYNEVSNSFIFFRDQCQVIDGYLSCNFPLPTPPVVEPTTAKIYYTSPSGVFTKRINLNDGSTIAGSSQTISTVHKEDVNPTAAKKQDMVYFNGHVFFDVLKNGSQLDRVLFKVNTSTNVISQVADLFAPTNTNGGYYGSLVVCNNDLYYTGNSDIYGAELVRYNNGANNIINAVSGSGGLGPSKTTCVGNILYFIGQSGAQTYLYKYDTTGGTNPVQLMNISQEGSSAYHDLVYVPGQNKIYALGMYNGAPSRIKFYDVTTNAQGTLAGTLWSNYGEYFNIGLGTDGTNLILSQAEIYVTGINRIFNYTTNTQLHYYAGSTINYEPTPVHYNNGRIFWSFKISTGSKKKILTGAESTLLTGSHYINKMENAGKSSLFAATQGHETSSPMYFFNTESMVNPLNIGYGVKFTIIPE